MSSGPERRRVSSGAPWEATVGYSRAVRAGDWVAVAGTTAAGPTGAAVVAGAADQTAEVLRRIQTALVGLDASLAHVVRTRIYLTDLAQWEEVGRVHGEFFADIRPAASMVEVNALIHPSLLVEIEADAVVGPRQSG